MSDTKVPQESPNDTLDGESITEELSRYKEAHDYWKGEVLKRDASILELLARAEKAERERDVYRQIAITRWLPYVDMNDYSRYKREEYTDNEAAKLLEAIELAEEIDKDITKVLESTENKSMFEHMPNDKDLPLQKGLE